MPEPISPAAAVDAEPQRAPDKSSPLPGMVMAMLGAVGFAGKAIIVKYTYQHYPGTDAVTLLMLRMLVALLPFAAIAWWASRGREKLAVRDRWFVVALGFSGYYLASFLDFWGLQYITASLERLILYLNPSLVLVLSIVFLGRRSKPIQWLAIALSYVGVFLVFGHELSFAGTHPVAGTVLVFASAVSYAFYLIYSGELVKRLGALRLTGLASIWACAFCLLQFALTRPLESIVQIPVGVWWLSLINGTFCTVLPVLLVMMGVQRIGAAMASQVGMIGPLVTIFLGIVLLNEPFTGWLVVGTLLVMGGMWLVARSK